MNSREFSRGLRLAISALVLVCAQACLVPQSVDPIVDAPHPPPHFVLESIPEYLLPPVLKLYRQGPGDASATPPCHCELELSIPFVEEDDPTITLEVRWFVDYDVSVPATVRTVWHEQQLTGDFDNPGTVRAVEPFDFDADTLSIVSNGVHRVDVVVGEITGFDDSALTRPNQTMKPGYELDRYSFFINVDVQQDQGPTCPSSPPSVRVCR